jgi:MFS family permease
MVFAVTTSVVADLAPAHLRGRYNGLWGVAWGAGSMLAPLLGSRLLAVGRPALWLTCLALCAAAAVGQLQLGPAIRRRSAAAHHPGAIGQPAPALTEATQA